MSRVFLIFVLCLVGSLEATSLLLKFSPEKAVHHTTQASFDVKNVFPGISMKGEETLKGTLEIITPAATMPSFDLKFVLGSLKIVLKANGEVLEFDSEDQGSSIYLSQLAQMVEKEIVLHVDDRGQVAIKEGAPLLLEEQLPLLKMIQMDALLQEMFAHPFVLVGEELEEGKTYLRTFSKAEPPFPHELNYMITEIDEYQVKGEIAGSLEPRTLSFEQNDTLKAIVNGTVNGQVTWNRDNALLYAVALDYAYSAKFFLGKKEWLVAVDVHVEHRSSFEE